MQISLEFAPVALQTKCGLSLEAGLTASQCLGVNRRAQACSRCVAAHGTVTAAYG